MKSIQLGRVKLEYREEKIDEFVIKEVMINNSYEKYFKLKNGCWLDIGAHIGTFSVKMAMFGSKVIAYEPEPENYKLLCANVENNELNVYTNNEAVVGNGDTERNFYVNKKKNTGANTLYGKRVAGREIIKVKCENINNILKNNVIDGMKIDCEGGEFEILSAIKDFFSIKQIVLEYHFNILGKEKYFEIIRILQKAGFKVHYKEPKKHWILLIGAER